MQEEQDGIVPVTAAHRDPLFDAAHGDEFFLLDPVRRDDFRVLAKVSLGVAALATPARARKSTAIAAITLFDDTNAPVSCRKAEFRLQDAVAGRFDAGKRMNQLILGKCALSPGIRSFQRFQ